METSAKRYRITVRVTVLENEKKQKTNAADSSDKIAKTNEENDIRDRKRKPAKRPASPPPSRTQPQRLAAVKAHHAKLIEYELSKAGMMKNPCGKPLENHSVSMKQLKTLVKKVWRSASAPKYGFFTRDEQGDRI